ncbi:serine/threonine protein kinase, partial [Candidatus Obscuribacterales bacterium]|nr:serine/threonine protein kinase [Candidatus Obscuribacterales bacterium]
MNSYPHRTTLPPESPEFVSRYQILKKLGAGGMGAVFQATDTTLDKLVAVKILLPGLSRENIIRFQQEARTAAKLDHPNIVKVLDFGQTPAGDLFLVMDYVGAQSLEDVQRRSKRLPVEEALPIFIQIAAGLHHAHVNKVLHRDVKPSNIMLCEKTPGNVQLVDFGLA